jgi:hypothetical protein
MESFETFLEMPLGHYGYKKFTNKTLHIPKVAPDKEVNAEDVFTIEDRNIIKSGVAAKKIESILNKTKWTWNILFIEAHRKTLNSQDSVYKKKSWLKNSVEKYITDNNIPMQGRITFAKNSSTGHLLTPWMTIHTMGHALLSNRYKEIWTHFYDSMQSWAGDDIIYTYDLARDLFMFQSAQKRNLRDTSGYSQSELVYELFAEYLWNGGKIRLNKNSIYYPAATHDIKIIYDFFEEELNAAVGQIVVDFFAP